MRPSPLLLAFALTAPIDAAAQSVLVVKNVRVFDGETLVGGRDVVLADGLIREVRPAGEAVPPGAAVVDGSGRTLLPGLIDAHVHLTDSAAADLRQALAFGVTTVLDMWSAGERLERLKALRQADAPDVADLRTAGGGATTPGGHPTQMGGPPFPTIADSAEADAFVRARIAEGSDYLKIILDDLAWMGPPRLTLDRRTVAGLVAAAHHQRKLAVVHVAAESLARVAVEAGADGLVHLFAAPTVGPDFADVVARHGAFVIPTLAILYGVCGQASAQAVLGDTLLLPYIRPQLRAWMSAPSRKRVESCDGTREAVRALAARGVPMLAGTDAPSPGHTYGASLHRELELLVGAGLTPTQALAAATSAPARAFGLTDRGRIAPGLRADLLLVDGDPTTDILYTRRIVRVWKRGVEATRVRYENQSDVR